MNVAWRRGLYILAAIFSSKGGQHWLRDRPAANRMRGPGGGYSSAASFGTNGHRVWDGGLAWGMARTTTYFYMAFDGSGRHDSRSPSPNGSRPLGGWTYPPDTRQFTGGGTASSSPPRYGIWGAAATIICRASGGDHLCQNRPDGTSTAAGYSHLCVRWAGAVAASTSTPVAANVWLNNAVVDLMT